MNRDDPMMQGFLYLKALIARYGVDDVNDLLKLADRMVTRGEFPSRRKAIEAIEQQAGGPVTTV